MLDMIKKVLTGMSDKEVRTVSMILIDEMNSRAKDGQNWGIVDLNAATPLESNQIPPGQGRGSGGCGTWMKHVTGVDTNRKPNGYALVGEFVNRNGLAVLAKGQIILMSTKGRDKKVWLMRRASDSEAVNLDMPWGGMKSIEGVEAIGTFDSMAEAIDCMVKNCGVPHEDAPDPKAA